MNILRQGALSAYQIASRMSWNITCDSWEQLPVFQRYFATGEAIAHLQHLARKKKILMKKTREGILFEPALSPGALTARLLPEPFR